MGFLDFLKAPPPAEKAAAILSQLEADNEAAAADWQRAEEAHAAALLAEREGAKGAAQEAERTRQEVSEARRRHADVQAVLVAARKRLEQAQEAEQAASEAERQAKVDELLREREKAAQGLDRVIAQYRTAVERLHAVERQLNEITPHSLRRLEGPLQFGRLEGAVREALRHYGGADWACQMRAAGKAPTVAEYARGTNDAVSETWRAKA